MVCIVRAFVFGGLYAGISYFLWIFKLDLADSLVSLPLILATLLPSSTRCEKPLGTILGVMVRYGSRASLLTPEAFWRAILETLGVSLFEKEYKFKALRVIIPPIPAAVFQLMRDWRLGLVNYLATIFVITLVTKRRDQR